MARRLPASHRTREELTALIEGRLSTGSAKDELVKLATRLIVEEALEGEAGDAVGRDYYEHGAQLGQGYRNGYRTGGLKTAEGLMEYSAPQIAGRDESFRSPIRPVTFAPGRPRLSIKPAPTGSVTTANTIGTVRVTRRKGGTAALVKPIRTWGASATSSSACFRRSPSSRPQRISTRRLRPSVQPSCCNPRKKARKRAWNSRSSATAGMSTQRASSAPSPERAPLAATQRPRRRAA